MSKISIPKIPQNLPTAIRIPLDKLRQAIVELTGEIEKPIDGSKLIFGTVTQEKIDQQVLGSTGGPRYYIDPTNGTAIKNSTGTLTILATRATGSGIVRLTSGNVRMFKSDGTVAGNGYTWTAAAADISDSIIITLKDAATGLEYDTITLIDVTDGGNAVIGAVTASNGLVSTRAIDAGAWSPVATTTDLTCNFYSLGANIASRVVRVTRNDTDGTLTAALQSNNGEPTTHSVGGSGTTAITITFEHTASGATVIEGVLTVQGGNSGATGLNSATVSLYNKNTSDVTPPAAFSGTFTYTFATALLSGGTLNGWTQAPPTISSGEFLWVRQAAAVAAGATDTIPAANFSGATVIGGGVGSDGLNSATVFVYQRNTSPTVAPTLPTTASATYTFSNGDLDPLNNGWTRSLPTSGDPYLWITFATASSTAATDEILAAEWATAELLAADGIDGAAGFNTATLTAYKRAAVAPTDDPGVSIVYTFNPPSWTPGNGWTQNIPSGTNPLYAVSATAYSQTSTDTILSADWSAPTLIVGAGLNVATAFIYQRTPTAVAPTRPSVTATYTFATGAITGLNNGWTDTVPAAGGNPFLWVSLATASSQDTTDTITGGPGEWQVPQLLASDGSDGGPGQAVRTVNMYSLNGDGLVAAPTEGSFATPISATNVSDGWTLSVPGLASNNDIVYVTSRIFTDDGLAPQDASWATPTIYARRTDGVGVNGQAVRTVTMYNLNDGTVADTTGGTFATPISATNVTDGWTLGIPSISANNDQVYATTRIFTDDGLAPQGASWATPTIYAWRFDGVQGVIGPDGPIGLRTIQGYLYYEKTTAGAPAAPSGNTYTFSTGLVTGTGINDAGTTDTWRNSPRPQDPTTGNDYYAIRYYGTEASSGSLTIAVTYSSAVIQTEFSGVVRFTGGTEIGDGTTIYDPAADVNANATTIDGGKITSLSIDTGQITAGAITANKIEADTITANELATTITFAKQFVLSTNGMLYTAGKTSFGAATAGIWMGYDAGVYKSFIGNLAAGNYMSWNGTDLVVRGNVSIGQYTSDTATVMLAANTQRGSVNEFTWTEVKKFSTNRPGTVRIYYDYQVASTAGGQVAQAGVRILLDGVTAETFNHFTGAWVNRSYILTIADGAAGVITVEVRSGERNTVEPVETQSQIRNVQVRAIKSDGESVVTD